jgi:hypothetical protein
MSETSYFPSMGITGLWTLNAPYSNLVLSTIQYKCIGTTSVAGAVSSGQDPLNTVYLANGDTQASYNTDLANDDYLITITSGPDDIVVFPRSALAGGPQSNGVVYHNTFMGISLSALPTTLDLTVLAQAIEALVLNQVGVHSEVTFATVGAATILNSDQATAVEAARQANITAPNAPLYENATLRALVAAQATKIALLSTYITQHGLHT